MDAQVKRALSNLSENEKVLRYLRVAQQYIAIQELGEAERYLLLYLQTKPESHEAHKVLGDLYLKQNKYYNAYEEHKTAYGAQASPEILAAICASAAKISLDVQIRRDWLKRAEKVNLPASDMLPLKEAILRQENPNSQDMEDVLKEQATLYPQDAESQAKLVGFYSEARRYEDCVQVILRVEGTQEMRTSPRWYKECLSAFSTIRELKALPLDAPLVMLHLQIASRLTLSLMTDSQLLSGSHYDDQKSSPSANNNSVTDKHLRTEDFHRQLQEFDTLLHDALNINSWYREGLWGFVLEHFTGQLLFIFAMAMLRRVSNEDEARDESFRKRAQSLMFAALEKRPTKVEAEIWFIKADEANRKLLQELYLDGCYRTAVCYHCLSTEASMSLGDEFVSRVKLAAAGNKAIEMITSRMFPGQAIKTVYNQAVISRTCQRLPERSQIVPYEANACVRMAGSLEHLAWFLVSGADIPTERIFRTLPPVPDLEHGGYNPAQSDIDAFLSAVHAAVRIFGAKMNMTKPTAPREVMQYSYTTPKQRKYWKVLYQRFVMKTNSVKGLVQVKKTLNDGLEFVRGGDGHDSRSRMPIWFMAQIARDLLKKAHKKSAYFAVAIHYYKRILTQLDDHSSIPLAALNSGSRTSFSSMFELPKQYTFDVEEMGRLRSEARIEIGKFLFFSGELENAIKTLAEVSHPYGYLYYARAVRKLSRQLVAEHDLETAEMLKERARALLARGIPMAKHDPELVEKLRRELDAYDMDNKGYGNGTLTPTNNPNGTSIGSVSLNLSTLIPRVDAPVAVEFDLVRIESIIKEQCDKIVADSAQRSAKMAFELAELKAMQGQLVDSVAKVAAGQTATESQLQVLSQTVSELKVKVSQLGQQITRLEEMTMLQQANQQDYHEYQDNQQSQQHSQQSHDSQSTGLSQGGSTSNYTSGALVIPPGTGLPQFNLTSMRAPLQAHAGYTTVTSGSGVTGYPSNTSGGTNQGFKAPGSSPTSSSQMATALPMILFDSPGTVFEKRTGQTNFIPVGGVHQITVFDTNFSYGTSTKTFLYYDATATYLKFTLNSEMTARAFEANGQTNLTWTVGGTEYYARFADLSCLPETLMRVFQTCGVIVIKSELPLTSNTSQDRSNKLYGLPSLIGAGNALPPSPLQSMAALVNKTENQKSSAATAVGSSPSGSFFTMPSATLTPTKHVFGAFGAISSGVTTTPTSSSTFSFSLSGSAASVANETTDTKTTPTTTKGVTFTSTTTLAVNSAKDKTPEKAQTTPQKPVASNPFAGFTFGVPKTDQKTPTFGAFNSVTTSPASGASAVSSSSSKPTFSFSTTSPVTPTTTIKPTFSFYNTTSSGASASLGVQLSPQIQDSKDVGEHVDEYEPTAHFQPVIELPDLVEVTTGEESEDVIFCERAKLYRFAGDTKEWKERGLGDLKILRHKDTGKYRVVMRREQVFKLCANHQIVAGLKLQKRAKDTELMWAAPDFADGEVKNEQFVVRFKTAEQASRFRTTFENGVKAAESKNLQKPTTSKVQQKEGATTNNLMDKFKPKAGSWECTTCYVPNSASDMTCVACSNPKPGTKSPVSSATVQPTFSFGIKKPATSAPGGTTTSFKFGLATSSEPVFGISSSNAEENGTSPTSTFSLGMPASSSTASITTSTTTSTTSVGFSFGGGASTGFVFGQPSNFTSTSSALATSPPKFGFGTPSGTDPSNKIVGNEDEKKDSLGGFTFGSPQKHEFSFEARHASEDEEEVAESKDVYFAPVIALPPVVEVVTGEEDQELVYSHRAKLYRFVGKEWKERGTGDFKLLKDPFSKKFRLTMRRDQVFKVCLNHYLTKEINFKRREDQRSIEWSAIDFAEGEPEPTLFALRVKTKEICDALLDTIAIAQSEASALPGTPLPSTVKTLQISSSSDTKSKEQKTPASSFSFKLEDNKVLENKESPVTTKSSEFKFGPSRNLFGSTSTSTFDNEVIFVKEEKASPQDVARARQLMLPDNFFLYETRCRKCKGCRGCDNDPPEEQELPIHTSVSTNPATTETDTISLPSSLAQKDASPARPTPVFGAQSTFGTTAAVESDSTTQKPPGGENGGGGFVFGSSTGMSFASLAQVNQNVEFNFATTADAAAPWTDPQNQRSFFTAFTKKANATADGTNTSETGAGEEGDTGEEVEAAVDVHFEPVIPLPELVPVYTGEEDDELLYAQRAKLYVYHPDTSEWKERALGEAKILRCSDGRARIVVRRDMVHKVACNHYITSNMELRPMATSNSSLTWCAIDFADGEPTPATFAIRVKGADRLDEFRRIFTEEVERSKQRSADEGAH